MGDEQFQKMHRTSVGLDEDEDPYKMADCRPVRFFLHTHCKHFAGCFHFMCILFPSSIEETNKETAARWSPKLQGRIFFSV